MLRAKACSPGLMGREGAVLVVCGKSESSATIISAVLRP